MRCLASISTRLASEYERRGESLWVGSPFAWIKTHPSRRRGKIGEQLVEAWCREQGLRVGPPPSGDADLSIEGKPVEVKLSMMWESGIFKFQQIRDQAYEYAFFLGLCPSEVYAWLPPKRELLTAEERAGLGGQHGGKGATETRWVSFKVGSPPEWLTRCGGTGSLDDVLALIRSWPSG